MMTFEEFSAFAKAKFPGLSDAQMERFRLMEASYRDWNAKINVISRKDMDGLYDHHVLHSLSIAAYLMEKRPEAFSGDFAHGRILDLGTGGGFPGIPLAVLFPEAKFVLCDSIGKKILVAESVAKELGLNNVETVNARAESLEGKFGYVVTRAVASLDQICLWTRGKHAKSILCLKGGDVSEEISAAMSRHSLPKGSVSTWDVNSWLPDPYFAGKFVIEAELRGKG